MRVEIKMMHILCCFHLHYNSYISRLGSTNIRKISHFKRFVRQLMAKNARNVSWNRHTSLAIDNITQLAVRCLHKTEIFESTMRRRKRRKKTIWLFGKMRYSWCLCVCAYAYAYVCRIRWRMMV